MTNFAVLRSKPLSPVAITVSSQCVTYAFMSCLVVLSSEQIVYVSVY